MINLKTPEEIVFIRTACEALSNWMEQCIVNLQAGEYLNGIQIAADLKKYTANLNVKSFRQDSLTKVWQMPFSWQKNQNDEEFGSPVCISVDDEIVHSRPTEKKFVPGNIITIDAGLSYYGWHADMARTVIFGFEDDAEGVIPAHAKLINGCRNALYQAYDQCKPGNTLKDISAAISTKARKYGFGVVIDYMGHGIGKELHEEPKICNRPGIFLQYDSIVLRPGMVFCIEPIFTLNNRHTTKAPDNWRIWTQDASMAVHFESEILITKEGHEVLTKLTGEYS